MHTASISRSKLEDQMMKLLTFFVLPLLCLQLSVHAQTATVKTTRAKVILDTDIGDDIDDAYALALLLKSPEIKIMGITTAFGDTQLRARLVTRMLQQTGDSQIPVYAGPKTITKDGLTQTDYAMKSPNKVYPDAIRFILESIRQNPGQITLISIAPLTNIGALLQQDPSAFRKLKRVVMMGGSVDRGYGPVGTHPDAEWNILGDISAAKELFKAGVPIFMMPLDSTQIKLPVSRQHSLFARHSPLTDALQELTQEWSPLASLKEPTLFDAVAAAYAIRPDICPTIPMHIEVNDKGITRRMKGVANANVCLTSTDKSFFDFYLPRVMQ